MCLLEMNGVKNFAYLNIIPLVSYVVFIGMDWLDAHHAILEWPTPMNVLEVISFMGLVGYYRNFIEGFSKLAHPITSLQKKGVNFD